MRHHGLAELGQVGLGQHLGVIKLDGAKLSLRYGFFAFLGGFLSPMFGRISFSLFLLSLVWRSKIPRWPLWVNIGVQVAFNVPSVILMYIQCGSHLSSLYDLDLITTQKYCWNIKVQSYWSNVSGCKSFGHRISCDC